MLTEQPQTLEGGIECIEISDPRALPAEPRVSIAMITYGHDRFIAEAIEGVLAQETDFPFELVIGEDRSPDHTMAIVRSFAEKRPDVIRIITSGSNVGARPNGLRVHRSCRGGYIAYCEGDDYWHHPRKLQMQVDLMEADPRVVLVHTDVDFYYTGKGIRTAAFNRTRGYRFDPELAPRERYERLLLGEDGCYTATVCARKALLDKIIRDDPHVFQTAHFPMADLPRWMELARVGAFAYIDESTATYRQAEESATRSGDFSKLARFSVKVIEFVLYYRDKYGVDEGRLRWKLDRFGMVALYQACMAMDGQAARRARELLPRLGAANHLLYYATLIRPLNFVMRGLIRLALAVRRCYRKARYGIESSI